MMVTTTIRVSRETHATLRRLAAERGESIQSTIDRVVEEYRRRQILEATNAAYARLREDPEEWAEIQRERAEWDGTLLDGLDPDEEWTGDGDVRAKPGGQTR